MHPERWKQVDNLLQSLLERPPEERDAYLRQACGGDPGLEHEVRSLLASQEQAGNFLENPAVEAAADLLTTRLEAGPIPSHRPERPTGNPTVIGRYRIVRLLGEGGMGGVYEAEQEQPRRIVALKVIKSGFCTPEVLRRFEHEAQALGRLQHPGIAQIYEAGMAETVFGRQPYFAMELIRGEPLMAYAESHQHNTRQRLELMARICEAAQHAHQRGLIHRDLKPGNILVDETGQPKILDFGVARMTGTEAEVTRQTSTGEIVGTLNYMSPEQVLADPLELDNRSDVYSLGVMLYELLSGRLPYNVSHRRLPEAVRTIREDEPTSLSSISRNFRGDIETIVSKALEKDKARRYASAADLAADIQRYLSDEPIAARPPSTTYQIRKFARRHRILVGSVAAVLVALAGGVVAATSQAIRANRAGQTALLERDRAQQAERRAQAERDRATAAEEVAKRERDGALQAQNAATLDRNRALAEKRRADEESATEKAVSSFLENDLLSQAGASAQSVAKAKPDPDLKVRTALDRAAAKIEGKFDKQPLVEASIRRTMATAYLDLGIYPETEKQLERVINIQRRVLGEEHPDTLNSMDTLAVVYAYQGQYGKAELLNTKVLDIERRSLGEEHPLTLTCMSNLATIYKDESKYAQAESLFTKVLIIERRVLGLNDRQTLVSINNLALLLQTEGKYTQAEPLYHESIQTQQRVLGEEHPDTLTSMNNLGLLFQYEGKYPQAEALFLKVLEIRTRVLGDQHPSTLTSMNNLGLLYRNEGKYDDAERLWVRALEIRRRTLGEEHPYTLLSMNNLASLYRLEGKYREAEPLATRALELRRRVLGDEHADTLVSMNTVGVLYRSEGKYADAESLLSKTIELRRRILGPEHPDTLASMSNLALVDMSEGKDADADALFSLVLEARRRVLGPLHPETLDVIGLLAEIKLKQKQYPTAEALIREALASYQKISSNSWQRYRGETLLGATLAAQSRYAEAEPLLVSGCEGMLQRKASIPFEERPTIRRAGEWTVQLYENWGKPEKAADWREKLSQIGEL